MRAVVTAIFGLAATNAVAAFTVSTTPDGAGFHLDGDAPPDAKYGCHCYHVSGNGTLVYDGTLTQVCCMPQNRHDDEQLCEPLEIGQSIDFLGCCVNNGGGHGYGGKCDAIESHTTVTSNVASPATTDHPFITSSLANPATTAYPNLRRRDRMYDEKICTCSGNPADAESCCWRADGVYNHDDQSCQIWDFDTNEYLDRYETCCNGATCSLVYTITAVSTGIVMETGPAKPHRRDDIVTLYPRDPSKKFPQFCVCAGLENSSCCKKASGVFFEPTSCEIDSASKLAEFTDCCDHSHACVNAPDPASTFATLKSIPLTWVKPTATVSPTAVPTYKPEIAEIESRDAAPSAANLDDPPTMYCSCEGIDVGLQWMCCTEYTKGLFHGDYCEINSQDQEFKYARCCSVERGMGQCG